MMGEKLRGQHCDITKSVISRVELCPYKQELYPYSSCFLAMWPTCRILMTIMTDVLFSCVDNHIPWTPTAFCRSIVLTQVAKHVRMHKQTAILYINLRHS